MNVKTTNILIVGVGGQGVILASELLSEAAISAGMDVKKSEVHGMAQRGGVVSCHVRFGKKVFSPLIPAGDADVLLAFEAAEGMRWGNHVRENGMLVVNTQQIIPTIAFTKGFDYPTDPIGYLSRFNCRVIPIEGMSMAAELGNVKAVNTILLGAISLELPISQEIWEKVIRRRVPRGTDELNLKAFNEGAEVVKNITNTVIS